MDPNKYQPSDGAGVFCPLAVEVCRRGMDEVLESGDDVLVGVVFVNPGDPDDLPEGTRLVFDPEGLVINPDPTTTVGRDSARDPSGFKMALPVWVLPPAPDEEGPDPVPARTG